MQTALVMTRARPQVTGLTKLLVTPGGGERDGVVILVDKWSDAVKEYIFTVLRCGLVQGISSSSN